VSTDAIVAAIRESGATRTPLRIAGRGTWLDAGRPVRAQRSVSLRDDTGVVSYVPGDLTLTVRAGTSLSEIERVTGEHDQWLPLDPYGSPGGSIGATIATASAGPLASGFGLPRDLVLGLEFVNGRGEVVRGGGKVVKNVAGFDLSRLMTGSWGTLGVITEVTLRLYALPKVDRSFAIALTGNDKAIGSLLHALVASPLAPYALVLLSRSASRALGLGDNPVCLIRFGGNDAAVRTQLTALSQLSRPNEVERDTWTRLRELEQDSHTAVRVSGLPRRLLAVAAQIVSDDVPGIRTYVDLRRGVLRVVASPESQTVDQSASVDVRIESGDSAEVIYEKLDPQVWSHVSPSVASDPLSQGIKKSYDPFNILNPGILGDLT
jgi:glycolate oxidase FAD binding subunit